jgi:hypothetical protein
MIVKTYGRYTAVGLHDHGGGVSVTPASGDQ